MTQFNNAMEIFKLLEKSNCKKCESPTCLAFAAAVLKGQKRLDQCPQLEPDILELYGAKTPRRPKIQVEQEAAMEALKAKVAQMDLAEATERLNASFEGNRLTLKILGKNFSIDTDGNFFSDIHIHEWIVFPVLNYILNCKGAPFTNNWVPLRELPHGKDWVNFFEQRCIKPLKRIADSYTGLFKDMIDLFNGQHTVNHYKADVSVTLHPLPRLPIMICYWEPEDGLASALNVFFDDTAEENLPIEFIYTLGAGLVVMFEKIALRHGGGASEV